MAEVDRGYVTEGVPTIKFGAMRFRSGAAEGPVGFG